MLVDAPDQTNFGASQRGRTPHTAAASMAAAVAAAAAFALFLVASPGYLAGADREWKGDPSWAPPPPFRAFSSNPLTAVPSRRRERWRNDTDTYSWPSVRARADRRSPDRSPDRSSREKRRALPVDSGRSARGRVAVEDEDLLAPKKTVGIFTDVADWEDFPSLGESTVMFLHIFKCAGSTTRRMMVAWAEAEGERGAVVATCDDPRQEEKVCLNHYRLLDEPVQSEIISRQKVLAGHFLWGFQQHVRRPYLMITALRNPLEVFVSAKQYTHKRKTKTLEQARHYISKAMVDTLELHGVDRVPPEPGVEPQGYGQPQIGGFIFRLVGASKISLHGELLDTAAAEAARNLDRFWIVGLVEQYAGFEEVLKRLLDPGSKHEDLWGLYSTHQFNTSPVGSRDVLAAMDKGLVEHFNNSLALQWRVYEKAVALWEVRCRDVLPSAMHQEMCTVGTAPSEYGFAR